MVYNVYIEYCRENYSIAYGKYQNSLLIFRGLVTM